MNTFLKTVLYSLIFGVVTVTAACQPKRSSTPEPVPIGNRKSPIAVSAIKHNNTYIKVIYGQPYRRGRDIFGDWEPYGEVWRMGANEATEIVITEAIRMSDETIEAGVYSLFSIPYEDHWTIIFNNGLGQWGAFDYNKALDYRRFDVPIITLETPLESFNIEFSEIILSATTMTISWDKVKVEIPIRFYYGS